MFGRKKKSKPKRERQFRIDIEDHSYRRDKDSRWEGHIFEKTGYAGLVLGNSREDVLQECERLVQLYRDADAARSDSEVIEL